MSHTTRSVTIQLVASIAVLMAWPATAEIPLQPYRYVTFGPIHAAGPATPDGEHIFLSASDGVHLYSLDTGRIERSFRAEANRLDLLSNYTYDAHREVLYAHGPEATYEWNWETGDATALPEGLALEQPYAILASGYWVIRTRADDDTISFCLTDPDTGEIVRTLFEGKTYAGIAFSSDGSRMALALQSSEPYVIEIFAVESGALLRSIEPVLPAAGYRLTDLVLSHDGWNVAATFSNTEVQPAASRTLAWNTGSEALLADRAPALGRFMGWPAGGLVTEKRQGTLGVFDSATLTETHEIDLDICDLYTATFSPDGGTAYLTGRNDKSKGCDMEEYVYRMVMQVVDLAAGEAVHTLKTLSGAARDFALDGNDSRLTLMERDSTLSTWSTEGYSLADWKHTLLLDESVRFPIALSRDGDLVACWSSSSFQMALWGTDGSPRGLLSAGEGCLIDYPSFSPTGAWLIGRCNSQSHIWDIATQQVAGTLPEYAAVFTGRNPKEVLRITGSYILVGPFDGDATVSRSISYPNGDEIWQLGMSRNGEYFWGIPWLTGSLLVGEVATGNHTWMVFPNFSSYVSGAAVSDDGRRVTIRATTLDGDDIGGVFDVASGQLIREVPVGSRAYFSADGDWIYANTSGVQQWAASVNGCRIQCGETEGDSDSDGLSDCVERCYQSDPENADTDGDYLPDGYEADEGYEPLLADAGADDDGDGLGIHAETYYGTNPALPDTDGDGASDLEEILGGTDPLVDESIVEGNGEGETEGQGEGTLEEGEAGGEEGEALEGGVIEGEPSEGELNEGELNEGEGSPEGEAPTAVTALQTLALFRAGDLNRDRRLDLTEFSAATGGSAEDFATLDITGDALLSVGELQRQVSGRRPLHHADLDGDEHINLTEALRVIQLRNGGGYDCASNPDETEDGYRIDADGILAPDCPPHASDHLEQDARFSLGELMRLIQLYNSGRLVSCDTSEDGFCFIA